MWVVLVIAALLGLGAWVGSHAEQVPALTDCRVADLDMDDTHTRFVITWKCPDPDQYWAVTYQAVSARVTKFAGRKPGPSP